MIAPGAPEPELPPGVRARFARDAREGEGPLEGLLAGLAATQTELALVAGGDMPDLQGAVLVEMLNVSRQARADAVALKDGDRFRPLPCVLRTGKASEAAGALLRGGDRRLRALLQALSLFVIDEPTWRALDPERRTLLDVDRPEDLER